MTASTIMRASATAIPLADASVQCVVTSPPYWGLRKYAGAQDLVWRHDDGTEWVGALGQEPTPEMFVAHLVQVCREVRRVLREDGTLWMNLGDSYCTTPRGNRPGDYSTSSLTNPKRQDEMDRVKDGLSKQASNHGSRTAGPNRLQRYGCKHKDLIGIPWMVAFALRADGWYLRSDIIWAKPNPMPESVRDRPTRAHEYVFLLTKAARYYYDADAIRTPYVASTIKQFQDGYAGKATKDFNANGVQNASAVKSRIIARQQEYEGKWLDADDNSASRRLLKNVRAARANGGSHDQPWEHGGANARSVWTITPKPFRGAHFATFPPELAEKCLKAGSRVGDTVLDPFGGSGTVAVVAERLGRRGVCLDISQEYVEMAQARLRAAREDALRRVPKGRTPLPRVPKANHPWRQYQQPREGA